MYLVYIDESGNTGLNLADRQQPIFVMAALVIPEAKWFLLEKEFHEIVHEALGLENIDEVHIQAKELKAGKGLFRQMSLKEQLHFRDRLLLFLADHEIVVIYRRIIKSRFKDFCLSHYGPGIKINPYIMALPFVCMEVNHYLEKSATREYGMFIFDEQKENLEAAERSLSTLRLDSASILKIPRIIEKGFFIDSKKSFGLQLVDIAAYYIRKYEEHKLGYKVSAYDQQTFKIVEKLISSGVGSNPADVLEWVSSYWIKQK